MKEQRKPESEFDAFTRVVDKVLSVPKAEILRREAEYKKQSNANPRKRGPKPKVKACAGGGIAK